MVNSLLPLGYLVGAGIIFPLVAYGWAGGDERQSKTRDIAWALIAAAAIAATVTANVIWWKTAVG